MEKLPSELKLFLDGDGRVTSTPAKYRKWLLMLWYLADKIAPGQYTEPEIGDAIDAWTLFRDPATIRRELVEMGFLVRTKDGSRYRRTDEFLPPEAFSGVPTRQTATPTARKASAITIIPTAMIPALRV